jgi:hypothetical protein
LKVLICIFIRFRFVAMRVIDRRFVAMRVIDWRFGPL